MTCALAVDACFAHMPAGLYYDGEQIRACPPGSGPNATRTGCAPCPAGYYAEDEGDGCRPCMAGWYSAEANQTACIACPPGNYSTPEDIETTACVPCAGGWFPMGGEACAGCGAAFKAPGRARCDACPAGQYAATVAASTCVDCAAGAYASAEGAVFCTPCAPGTYASNPKRAVECSQACEAALGYFSGAGATACAYCSGGLVNESLACVGCGLGRYATRENTCALCPAGKVQASTSFANTSALCVACGGAAFASADRTHCIEAALGYEPNAEGTAQRVCGVGTFRGPDQYACTPCADGLYSLTLGAAACRPCAAGKYRVGPTMSVCFPCDDGSVAPEEGSNACAACPPGTSPSEDRTTCVECEVGYYSANGVQCFACPNRLTTLTRAASECVRCPDWTTYLGVGLCGPCGPGQYMVRDAYAFTFGCAPCPGGTYNPSSGGLNLSACVRGPCAPLSLAPNAETGATHCAPCPIGSASTDGLVCRACTAGSYGVGCPLCPPGTFTAVAGSTACTPCEAGHWTTGLGATACTPCPPGTAGEEECLPCPTGTVMPDAGAAACRPRTTRCAPGHIVVPRIEPSRDNECLACTGCDADQYALLETPLMSTWDTFVLRVSADGASRVDVPDEACPGNTTRMGYTCIDNHFTPGMYLKAQETIAGLSGGGGSSDAPIINLNVMRCTQLAEPPCDGRLTHRMAYVTGGTFECFVGCRYGLNADAVRVYAQRYGVASGESLEGNVFLARRAVCFDPPLCAACPTEACATVGRYRPVVEDGCGPACLLTPERCRDPDTGRANYGCDANCAPPPANAYHTGGGGTSADDEGVCPFACQGSPNGIDPGYHLSDDGTRCERCGECADPQSVPIEPCYVYHRTADVCRRCPLVEGGRPRAWAADQGGRCTYACQMGYYASEDATTCLHCTALNGVECPAGTFRDVAACRPDKPPPCTPCATPEDMLIASDSNRTTAASRAAMLTFASAGAVSAPYSCNATCGAGLHSLRRSTGAYVDAPLPVSELLCKLCGFADPVPCHGRCAAGQYRDPAVPYDSQPGACKPCRVSANDCPTGQYAPLCSGNGTGDALCRPCAAPPAGRVIVPYEAARSAVTLQRGLVQWDGVTCPTACAPNHVMLQGSACVPCRGTQAGMVCAPSTVPGQPTPCDFVYAHWNATDGPMWWAPASTPPWLNGLEKGRRAGVCWACPTGTGTLDGTGTDLCQLLPGFGLAYDPLEVYRVPIPTEPGAVIRSLREPQPLLVLPPPARGRRMLSLAANDSAAAKFVSSSTAAGLMPVPFGTYGDGSSVYPINCPQGMSTRTTGSVSAAQCECMPGYYYHYYAEPTKGRRCVECPADTYRSVNMPHGACAACAANETTFERTGQSACACAAGWRRAGEGGACVRCEAGRFCRPCYAGQKDCPSSLGVWVVPCMTGGVAPPGSTSLLNCTCERAGAARLLRPGYTLEAIARQTSNRGLYCLEPPPHTVYDNATLTLRCRDGWTPTYVKGVSPPLLEGCALCGRGRFSPSGALSDCRDCPLGTYMDRPDGVGACTPCSANLTTLVAGATRAEQCACPLGMRRNAQTQRCEGCALGQYATPERNGCLPCPEGTTSRMGAANASDCVCVRGTVRVVVDGGPRCQPCPIGTFAAHDGQAACTPCGPNRITAKPGAVSSTACACAAGFTPISGVLCVNSSALALTRPSSSSSLL